MVTVAFAFSGVGIWTVGVVSRETSLTYVGSLILLGGCILSIGQIRTLLGDPKPKAGEVPRISITQGSLKKEGVSS